jgi:hypothetical protein
LTDEIYQSKITEMGIHKLGKTIRYCKQF